MGVSDAQVFCEGRACGVDAVVDGEFLADSPVCSGDSGGPALDESGRVSGVISRGDAKCTVGIYSSVAAWSDFILERTFMAATSGRYNPPAWAGEPPTGTPGTNSGGSPSSGMGGGLAVAGTSSPPAIGGAGAVGGSSGDGSPVVDPLGSSCTNGCPGAYVCWAASDKPPGICVPQCSPQQSQCPGDYSCDAELGACLRTAPEESGCSVVPARAPAAPPTGVWLALLGFAAMWSGRRSKRASRIGRA
jgi:MYXO-CTERM domain-containing protein